MPADRVAESHARSEYRSSGVVHVSAWRFAVDRWAIPALAGVGIVLILLFLAAIFLHTLSLLQDRRGLASLAGLFGSADYYAILADTFYFAAVTTATAMAFGVPIAWLTERTDLPCRNIVRVLMTGGVLIPGFFTAMGWLFLAHPRIGIINVWLRDSIGITLNLSSFTGMGLVQGLALATLGFIVSAPSLAAIDPGLEESGEVHGLTLWHRLSSVTLPLMTPAMLASAVLIFMVSLAVFDIPAVIGLSNKLILYSTYVYDLVNPSQGVPSYELAAASSLPMLLLAVGLSLLYYRLLRRAQRYQVVSGKAYRAKRLRIGRRGALVAWIFIALYLTLSELLPLLAVAWSSLLPFFRPVSLDALKLLSFQNYAGLLTSSFWDAARNSVLISLTAPTATVMIGLAVSWVITRQRGGLGRLMEMVAFLPLAIPSVIFAVGAISIGLALWSLVPIYGTIWLIVLVEVVIWLSLATRITNSAMLQIHNELDEAGAVFGLPATTRFIRIMAPLLAPAAVYCWFFLALLAFRELTVPALLAARDNVTIPVYTYGLLSTGIFGPASALTIMVIAALIGLALAGIAINRFLARFRIAGGAPEAAE